MLKKFITNISYALFANIISTVLGVLQIIILPKFLSNERYGYYQLYMFYGAYSLITTLGIAEGIYLKLGGCLYGEIDKKFVGLKFWIMNLSQVIIYLFIAFLVCNSEQGDQRIVLCLVCIACIVCNAQNFIKNLLQAVGEIKIYANIIIIERVISVCTCILLVFVGYIGFALLLIVDLIAKTISVIYAMMKCKDIFLSKLKCNRRKLIEGIKSDISSGHNLLIAMYSSTFITGIIRYGIQRHWDIVTFGKISLTISIANLFLRCINSIAVVLFPELRKQKEETLKELYTLIETALLISILFIMIFFTPLSKVFLLWLPQYSESILYAVTILPMCLFECKNALLISTYFKTLRKEKIMMKINILSCIISSILTYISVFWANSINLAILSILISVMVRSILSEIVLSKCIKIKVYKNMVLEIGMTVMFIICNSYLKGYGTFVFICAYILMLFIEKKDIKKIIKYTIVKKKKIYEGFTR